MSETALVICQFTDWSAQSPKRCQHAVSHAVKVEGLGVRYLCDEHMEWFKQVFRPAREVKR